MFSALVKIRAAKEIYKEVIVEKLYGLDLNIFGVKT
tara:strand:- start:304 stop:411 length:108 start_codon:yes stop_codon:yes gene_type:complete